MTTQIDTALLSRQIQTRLMLHELGFPVHLIGYKQLCIAIPQYSMDDSQSLTKDRSLSDCHAASKVFTNLVFDKTSRQLEAALDAVSDLDT